MAYSKRSDETPLLPQAETELLDEEDFVELPPMSKKRTFLLILVVVLVMGAISFGLSSNDNSRVMSSIGTLFFGQGIEGIGQPGI